MTNLSMSCGNALTLSATKLENGLQTAVSLLSRHSSHEKRSPLNDSRQWSAKPVVVIKSFTLSKTITVFLHITQIWIW